MIVNIVHFYENIAPNLQMVAMDILARRRCMNAHEGASGTYVANESRAIAALGTHPHPPGGNATDQKFIEGIPFPDLRDFVCESALIRVLERARHRSPRAARIAARRWIERHQIPTLRMGHARFFPRHQVWRAFAADAGVPLHAFLHALIE